MIILLFRETFINNGDQVIKIHAYFTKKRRGTSL